ncbi:hypothetical protein [Priestia aryabhattai]
MEKKEYSSEKFYEAAQNFLKAAKEQRELLAKGSHKDNEEKIKKCQQVMEENIRLLGKGDPEKNIDIETINKQLDIYENLVKQGKSTFDDYMFLSRKCLENPTLKDRLDAIRGEHEYSGPFRRWTGETSVPNKLMFDAEKIDFEEMDKDIIHYKNLNDGENKFKKRLEILEKYNHHPIAYDKLGNIFDFKINKTP